jgi:hypothetical protein
MTDLPLEGHHRKARYNRKPSETYGLHEVSLEEGLQLPLGCRIGEIPDIESSSLCCAGQDRIVLSGLVGVSGFVRDGRVAKRSSNVIDSVRNLFHNGRHDELTEGF